VDAKGNKLVEKINEELIKKLSYTSQGSLVGLTSFIGGVVAQEALKAVTGKFTPLNQWLYVDSTEILPALTTAPSHFQPKNSRYDAQLICLGTELCEKLSHLSLFMVGAGAIGCEMMKNYAMMGVSTGKGLITITDNDLIEKSNLNRQFLFRSTDIQKAKSDTSARVALQMNPQLHISARMHRVGQETESEYADNFFQQQDVCVNALDNVPARMYMDARCVTNCKPLLESGTLGTKGHIQNIYPHLTQSYASDRDPPEKDVPFCTLKSFPYIIDHTIQWGRDKFENLFFEKPSQLKKFYEDPEFMPSLTEGSGSKLGAVRSLSKLIKNKPRDFADCVIFARIKFEKYFKHKQLQLLHNFPVDMIANDGTPFWTLPKRPPQPLEFDPKDKVHMGFIMSTALIWANIFGITATSESEVITNYLPRVKVPTFKVKSKKVETDEKTSKEEALKKNRRIY